MDMYIITNGNGRYIRYDRYSNRYVAVNRLEYATRFEDRDKARHICAANIPKSMGTGYHIEVVEPVRQPDDSEIIGSIPIEPRLRPMKRSASTAAALTAPNG